MITADQIDVDFYINFALHAVLGRLGEADTLMRVAGDSVRRVAAELSNRHPIVAKPLYRGILLEPTTSLQVDPHYTFISWSEDENVARWFASTRSVVSKPLMESTPNLRGFMIKLDAPSTRILFHHSWMYAIKIGLDQLALFHPLMSHEGSRQIGWSLRTQQEVITEPVDHFDIEPANDDIDISALDRRLAPTWCLGGAL